MKHLLIILSILLLSSPVIGQETGVLFLREVNDKWEWFEDGNKDKDANYIGEFKDGKEWSGMYYNADGSVRGRFTDGNWKKL